MLGHQKYYDKKQDTIRTVIFQMSVSLQKFIFYTKKICEMKMKKSKERIERWVRCI